MLRATRTRRPARSISISVRLVSSSNSASSRMSALSSILDSWDLSAGWRAMILIRNFLSGDVRERQALASGFGFGADFGGKACDREPVAVDAEAGKGGERGHRGEGMVPEVLTGVDIADVDFDRWNVRGLDCIMQRDRGVRIAAGIEDDPRRL